MLVCQFCGCEKLADSDRFDVIIALGAVIHGSMSHFDFVAGECAKSLGMVGLDTSLPVLMVY